MTEGVKRNRAPDRWQGRVMERDSLAMNSQKSDAVYRAVMIDVVWEEFSEVYCTDR